MGSNDVSGKDLNRLTPLVVDDLHGKIYLGQSSRFFHILADVILEDLGHPNRRIAVRVDCSVKVIDRLGPGHARENGFGTTTVARRSMRLDAAHSDPQVGASKVMMIPAGEGTGVIAGASVRAVMELAGVKDVLTKAYGSTSPKNLVKAAFEGLRALRSKEDIEKLREVSIA